VMLPLGVDIDPLGEVLGSAMKKSKTRALISC
jgi:hypothetical protein